MKANDEVERIDDHEGDVEERPEILRVDVPAVLKHRSKFIENPASSIYREADLVAGELRMISVHHTDAI